MYAGNSASSLDNRSSGHDRGGNDPTYRSDMYAGNGAFSLDNRSSGHDRGGNSPTYRSSNFPLDSIHRAGNHDRLQCD